MMRGQRLAADPIYEAYVSDAGITGNDNFDIVGNYCCGWVQRIDEVFRWKFERIECCSWCCCCRGRLSKISIDLVASLPRSLSRTPTLCFCLGLAEKQNRPVLKLWHPVGRLRACFWRLQHRLQGHGSHQNPGVFFVSASDISRPNLIYADPPANPPKKVYVYIYVYIYTYLCIYIKICMPCTCKYVYI